MEKIKSVVEIVLLIIFFLCTFQNSSLKNELKKTTKERGQQAETIELLRGELQKYAAIEQIINSRCLDNLEPVLMEVE